MDATASLLRSEDGSVVVPPELASELLRYVVVGLTVRVRADGGELSPFARRLLRALHEAAERAEHRQPAFADESPLRSSGRVELTAQQAAALLECSAQHARFLARTGRLTARRA